MDYILISQMIELILHKTELDGAFCFYIALFFCFNTLGACTVQMVLLHWNINLVL